MNGDPDIAVQERSLLALVAEDRDRRLRELTAEARARARTIVGEAFAASRERVREAFAEERARQEEALSLADARLASRRRQIEQRLAGLLLQRAWVRLPEVLRARWDEPASRSAWTRTVLGQARAVLPPGRWRVEGPAVWPVQEREEFSRAVREVAGETPEIASLDGLRAGVRLATAGNCVDGTLEGLLADREAIAARLLHFLAGVRR